MRCFQKCWKLVEKKSADPLKTLIAVLFLPIEMRRNERKAKAFIPVWGGQLPASERPEFRYNVLEKKTMYIFFSCYFSVSIIIQKRLLKRDLMVLSLSYSWPSILNKLHNMSIRKIIIPVKTSASIFLNWLSLCARNKTAMKSTIHTEYFYLSVE